MKPVEVPGDVPSYSNLGILFIVQLCVGMTFSLMSPFYSKEAVQKGMSITETGIVYSVAFLMTVTCSPVFGKYIERIGSRTLFLLGILVAGMGTSGFGFLHWVEGKHAFFGLSLSIRIITSVAIAALYTAITPLTIKAASKPTYDKIS